MKIFITGGSGFIGSNYILKYINHHKILNFDKLTYAGNNDNLNSLQNNSNYQFVHGDICDLRLTSNTILAFQPDIIINFAAESHVDRSIDSPKNFIDTNIIGTFNLLTVSLNYWIKYTKKNSNFKFLQVSTDEVFGSLEIDDELIFTENSVYNPTSPYAASKASADHLVKAWHLTYGLPILITNCSNNYGPFQFPEKLIPLIIANCLDEKPLPIYGKGLNIRDWIYVDDHCEAIYKVLTNSTIGESYNIGSNNEVKNIDIVKAICSVLDDIKPRRNGNTYDELITYVTDRAGHDLRYAIDSSKIRNSLGWQPTETVITGIKKTVNWYIDNESWWRKIQKKSYNQERLGLINKI